MKTIQVFITLLFISGNISAKHNAILIGKIKNPLSKSIHLTSLKDQLAYKTMVFDSTKLNDDGSFKMYLTILKNTQFDLKHGEQYTNLQINPNDSIYFTLDGQNFDSTLVYSGKGAEKNNYLAKNILTNNPLEERNLFGLDEINFVKTIDSSYQQKIQFLTTFKGLETSYVEENKELLNYEWINRKLRYPFMHNYISKEKQEISKNYYNFLSSTIINNPKSLNINSYTSFLELYLNYETQRLLEIDSTLNEDSLKMVFIENRFSDEVKEYLVAKTAFENIKSYNVKNANLLIEKYVNSSKSKKYLQELKTELEVLKKVEVGNHAPNFTYKNLEGSSVSLSDFKGKVVYIDVWASWCGPCKREIPASIELEKELHDKDVVFLAVSIDKSEESWRKIINDKKLKGVHLLADNEFESQIVKLYNITGVPHYMLIDKNGKISDNNAKRPSMGVKEDILKLLNP